MSAPLVARLFHLVGQAPPGGVVARTFARAPRERLVRAVAWYAHARTGGVAASALLSGLRLVVRGWDDMYFTATVPRGARRADLATPSPRQALVIRHGRAGRGWEKESLPTIGKVRGEIDLAVAWLAGTTGCILHDDCAAHPELGAACAGLR
ncbi:MAG: hypothetical protein KIT84_19895 [Labilithrix sp.]|nr:hypothetical protein [Labilithrix sp.]MCW5813301.1 hypothetical protein [Labilithrix sp.]